MKNIVLRLTILACFMGLAGCVTGTDPLALTNDSGRISYSIGYQVGSDYQKQGWKFDAEQFLSGVSAALENKTPALTPEEMHKTLAELKKSLTASQGKAADAAFLSQYARQEGVVALPSGVHYKVLRSGTGIFPSLKDEVAIRYQVRRATGQELTASGTDTPTKSYAMAKVLPGLREVLLQMPEGSRWEIVLPSGPALGSKGEALEPSGVLIYELELVAVQPGE